MSAAPVTVYVPRDSAATSVGADEVADEVVRAAARVDRPIRVIRNGSRGMLWLEPLVEVVTAGGRIGYGPVTPGAVDDLVDAGLFDAADHPSRVGVVEDLPWLATQDRVTFARVGVTDPLSPNDYLSHGGLAGLRRALEMSPPEVVAEVTDSGLRGRGGAGFPAGIKWKTVLECVDELKFVCCNADEGDSGTFADRMVMEGDPFMLIEGMTIAAYAVGATEGYIYIRSEYPDAVAVMRSAIEIARGQGWLGESVLGSPLSFDMHVRVGGGAYICGEETSMLESLEGKRGMIRAKPPIPGLQGLFGKPTVVNNVLSLGSVPMVLADGAAAFQAYGVGRSRGDGGGPEATPLAQVLRQIEQRPLGTGRHLHIEAGRRGDHGAEGGRAFVDQPQQIGKLQSLLHSGSSIIVIHLPDSGFPSRYGRELRPGRAHARGFRYATAEPRVWRRQTRRGRQPHHHRPITTPTHKSAHKSAHESSNQQTHSPETA